ncbi:MAG: metal-dependent transcriptional regulator [Chitinophagaceae bacterium]|nr:metal-dependent transcriptional regulator [Chitinophagaceae bacterium]
MTLTYTEEDYIKGIYHLQQTYNTVSTNQLASLLEATPASITDMLKKLKAKKLLNYEKYKGFHLTAEGKKLSVNIVRRHRLWEYFLVEKLQFGWDEVHEVAEELEHITSKKLVEKLDAFLGHPRFDPHGDPIPDNNGKITPHIQLNLIDLPLNTPAEICSVGSQSSSLLELLNHKHINIGTRVEVKRRFGFDRSLEIKLKNQPAITLSQQLAQALFVKTI